MTAQATLWPVDELAAVEGAVAHSSAARLHRDDNTKRGSPFGRGRTCLRFQAASATPRRAYLRLPAGRTDAATRYPAKSQRQAARLPAPGRSVQGTRRGRG